MRIQKKNILSGALFLLGLLVLLVGASIVFRPQNNTQANGMEDERANGVLGEPEDTIDVLFLGDSITYCSIIPMQIWRDHGITSYLCGTSLQELYYAEEFLSKTFATQSPKVVVLGMIPMYSEFSYTEEVTNKIERILPIFRYHDRWKNPNSFRGSEWKVNVDYTYQEVGKGYYYSLSQNPEYVYHDVYYTDAIDDMPDICKKAVRKIKEICDEHDTQLIFLGEMNGSGTWSPERHNAVQMLATELGVEFLDLNYLQDKIQIKWKTEAFDSSEHLNYYGAQKITKHVGQYLADTGLFEDKRENPEYDFWNETQVMFYEGKPE